MPVVSHKVTPLAPMSSTQRCAQPSTAACGTSPSIGQPNEHDSEMLTLRPAATASVATCASAANDCSRVMRRFARLWVSLDDITRFSSSVPASIARSAPRTFGTSAV